MQTADPYRAPVAQVADPASSAVCSVNIWSPKGRLGRVRYIGYSVGLGFLINFVSGFLTAMAGSGPGAVIMVIGLAAGLFVHGLLSVQRAHDFNATGWMAILAFIPLLNFLFWFIPGTDGDNRFGSKTPPNSKLAIVLASIIPVMMIAGIVAAIAIPSYQAYVQSSPATIEEN
ncbi:MAG: DUF805 domain-containing protein [Betaproteobacteria bacterium]|nr:MAG: DUF805 domain-containing protein [Betaproteobacteria bacterium]